MMDNFALKHFKNFKDLSSRVMRWSTYLAPLTFGIKFLPGAQNVSDSLSKTDLEDIDYQSAKNLEIQAGFYYPNVATHDQAVQEQEDDYKHQELLEDKEIEVKLKLLVRNHFQSRRCLSG
jgi:hypothetical protein